MIIVKKKYKYANLKNVTIPFSHQLNNMNLRGEITEKTLQENYAQPSMLNTRERWNQQGILALEK